MVTPGTDFHWTSESPDLLVFKLAGQITIFLSSATYLW